MVFNKPLLIATCITASSNFVVPIKHTIETNNVTATNKSKIIDFNATMLEAYKTSFMFNDMSAYQRLTNISDFEIKSLQESNMSIDIIGKPVLDFYDKTFNYMGENVFVNNTPLEQTLTTGIFTRELTSEVGHATKLGISLNLSKELEVFGVKNIFDFSTSESKSETTKDTYTVTPQNIKVPPHKQITAHVYWTQVRMVQEIGLNVDINAQLTGEVHMQGGSWNYFKVSIADAIYYLQLANKCPEGISINSNNSVHFHGIGQSWHSSVGTNFYIKVDDPIDPTPDNQ